MMIAVSDGGLPWVRRSLDVEALLARRSVFLFGPRQTGKTTWVRRQLSGTVAITFSLLDQGHAGRVRAAGVAADGEAQGD